MSPKQKRALVNVIGIVLSAIFLYLCFHSLDRESLKQAFLLPKPWLLAAVVVSNFLLMAVRARLWSLLLRSLKALPFWTLFDLLHVGYMANNLLPLKAGEFFRASFVSKRWNLPYTQVLTTVGLERFFPGYTLILILLMVAEFLNLPLWIRTGAYVTGGILVGVQIGLLVLWRRKPDLAKWKKRHPAIYRSIEFLTHVGEGSKALRSPISFLHLSLLAIISWGIQAGMLWTIQRAFNLSLGIMPTLFVIIAINLAVALPSAPSGIGTFEFAAVLAYNYLGIPKATAVGIGFYFHFLQAIPITLIGLFYYFRWGLRLKDIEASEAVGETSLQGN